MIQITCDGCKKDLEEPGGLLFSPQSFIAERYGYARKFHLCINCYEYLFEEMMRIRMRKNSNVV